MSNEATDPAASPASPNAEPSLQCFGGAVAPLGTAEDLRELAALPTAARAAIPELLSLALPDKLPAGLDEAIGQFSVRHELPEGRAVRALRVCRLMLRQAARRNLSADAFAGDLATLAGPSAGDVQQILMPLYADAMDQLRHEIRYGALIDHGQLLTGVDWRVDVMKHAHRGSDLDEPVVLVTLQLREGEQTRRVTFQALPDMLHELAAMCRQLLA